MDNVHLVTGYAGKTHVTSADHGAFWAAIIGDGEYILNRGSKFAATKVSNNLVRIADGEALVQGRHVRVEPGITVDLTVENGTVGTQRRDLIVLRYTKSASTGVEDANLVVLRGDPVASNPADPAYTAGSILDGDVTHDFPLYRVKLNATEIEAVEPLFAASFPGFFNYMRPQSVAITASTTLSLDHADRMLMVNSASAVTITIPTHAAAAFPVGTMISICRLGAGAVSLAAASGVTLHTQGDALTFDGQYGAVTLYKLGANEWCGWGALV